MEILSAEMKKKLRGRDMLWKQSSLRMLQFLSYGGIGEVFNTKLSYPIETLLNDYVIFELGALANKNDKTVLYRNLHPLVLALQRTTGNRR